ncbi:S8 family serine peptidase [Devosia sp. XJ19-1]|uniref:S8 family serine peptidase n=1 Tax=Devosia ureilytica TaxID=2952754 RepID=A0A9Q4AQW4_9HYPH|nr:S8 family peptidase [Devosia ureilytica]MCP8884997.1 S8 family serine peptidase [Devosia ureilytica]MCP8888492.1 S8 family serine peptidase [Devosia ureilytica]
MAATYAASAEFRSADASCASVGCGVVATGTQSSPFQLHNVHWAHSAGLTGAGTVVAIVDDGFRLTHREFSGKTISQTGTLPLEGHGTFVASLATGNKDGLGMHGVAPDADLHLTSFQPTGAGFSIANVTTGTLAAAGLDAVAQNNSWGFDVSAKNLEAYLATNTGASVAQGLDALLGYGSGNWQSYINALDTFQDTGVVVWALSNNENLANGDVLAALPHFESRLSEAWIAAANGYFQVNSSGDITRAVRLSAACGLAAQFCIAGDGIATGAWSNSDTSYASGYGTSFVAPQVAGAVALLAEAFPDMTPSEWAQRLLASADNSWFASQGVPLAGTIDYGNGVSHAYSTEWGHGVMDIKAALSPIGSVSVLSGDSVTTAERHSLAQSTIVAPASFGDSLTLALAPQQMAVFDALNRSYSVSPVSAVATAPAAVMPTMPGQASLDQAGDGLNLLYTGDLASAVGGFSGRGGRSSVLSMAGESLLIASNAPVGSVAELTTFGFAAEHGAVDNGHLAGGGVALTLPAGNGNVRFGATLASEQGGVMGLDGGTAFDFGGGSTIGAVNLGLEQNLAPGLSLFGQIEYGAAARQGSTSGLVADISGLTFSGMEIGASFADTLVAGDRLSLFVSQPLRIETGTVELNRPVARLQDGSLVNETSSADLNSTGRQIDLGLAYQASLPNAASLSLGVKHAVSAGHVAGQSGTGVMLGYRQGF